MVAKKHADRDMINVRRSRRRRESSWQSNDDNLPMINES